MSTLFRWLLHLFAAAVVLAGVAMFAAYWLASRSLPDYAASHEVSGIGAEVEIVRDNANVPHVFGQSDTDVYFGLGFVHAQDRLWQMMMMRRTVQGRLSEIFGEETLKIDELLRRLDLYNLAAQSVAVQDEPTQKALLAYSAGVNSWLEQVNAGALGRGAPEFFLFSNQMAPWTPADSIAMLKLMSLQLSGHMAEEVRMARSSLLLRPERVDDLLPMAPGTGVAALPEYAAIFPDVSKYAAMEPVERHPLMPMKSVGLAGASNAWAAAPSRSATGSTLLANDPHLGFTAPAVWYLARLELSTGGVIGGTIPGMPLVIAGRSESFGWAVTSSYVDDQDVFIEKLNPDNPDEVLGLDGFVPMVKRSSIIKIKDAPPVTIDLRWSENGPILPGHHFGLENITPKGHVAALGWTALSPRDTTMMGAIRMMSSKTIAQGIEAGSVFVAPSQNVTMTDGIQIALKTVGALPRRAARHQTRGRMPAPGWLAVNRWQGWLNYQANPEFVAPEGGILGNTNNKTIDRPFPLHVSYLWGDTQRVQRWRRLMQNREVHSRESFIEAQLDTVSFSARSLLPLVGADLWFADEAAPEGTQQRLRQTALKMLAEWNGEMNEHLPEPLIYAAWMRALQERLIRDEIGPLSREFPHVQPLLIERVFRDIDGASVWCDVLQSAEVETCSTISRLALDDALVWISEKYGTNLESLRWGDAHQALHDHQVLGQVPVLKWFVNIRQSTSGGDDTLGRGRTSGKDPEPFSNVHGAGFRGVYDFADPDSSVFITSTGQSGHFLSRHYDDLGALWRRGEYVPMSLDPDLARAAAVGVTHLSPRN